MGGHKWGTPWWCGIHSEQLLARVAAVLCAFIAACCARWTEGDKNSEQFNVTLCVTCDNNSAVSFIRLVDWRKHLRQIMEPITASPLLYPHDGTQLSTLWRHSLTWILKAWILSWKPKDRKACAYQPENGVSWKSLWKFCPHFFRQQTSLKGRKWWLLVQLSLAYRHSAATSSVCWIQLITCSV